MSPSEKNSSNFVETKQDDLKMIQDSSLNSDIIHDPKKLKDRIMDLLKGDTEFSKMKQGDKALVVGTASGLFAAVLPFLAVGATLAIPSAIVGLTLFFAAKVAVKAVQSGYKGLKWSAEKTVEGAKHIGGKIKDGAVYAKNSVKETASSVKQATQERASSTLRKMGDNIQNLGRKMSDSGASMSSLDGIAYSIGNEDQTVILKTKEKTRSFNSVKEMFVKEVFEDKGVNSSALTRKIFSKLGEKILEKAYSVDGQHSAKKDQLINRLKQQIDFINKLDAKKLQHLLAKDNSSLYEIFSEHHDEIKEVIKECKEEHTRFNTLERLNKSAKRHKASSMNSLENSLSGSSSTSSISTVSSKAELLNPNEHKEVKEPTSFWSKLLPSLKGGKKPEEATYIRYQDSELDQIQSAEIGNSRFYVAPEKPPRSNSMGSISTDSTATTSSFASYRRNSDSGFNSPSSSPEHGMFTEKNGKLKTQADLRKTGSLDKLVGPSSTVTAEVDVEHQAPKMKI
ncbi:hypothetical protein C1A_685 [Wolbachia endosymbiont of Culex quinquefasciatus JHB]|uniref:Jg19515 protein n=1 Tax=Pararge aegeria aegeria TaxID=348720 RepID=A0A8S4QS26_9NEOP|nr:MULTISPECIES: hypothetical protein [unclassified Wolbachia]EEB56503.1 hypothetical protein C1A_685 [Wolbachia endosymbiont of Culex quinquefasciatus JHB]CAH2217006.1 jg19515 [Pararge aegeria aegeria]CAQ55237.1 hypothetical protein WP1129 [Wolbachia endosymbiont of Culex quinquefasciatus Pel]CQD05805.1 Uncharacterised protein [Wolbachia endosymbiont wPip_Mol of Culex molestus]